MPILRDHSSSPPPPEGTSAPRSARQYGDRVSHSPFYDSPSTLGSMLPSFRREQLILRIKEGNQMGHGYDMHPASPSPESPSRSPLSPLLLAPFQQEPRTHDIPSPDTDQLMNNHEAGLEIQRPRSAFHSGDFRDRSPTDASVKNSARPVDTGGDQSPPRPDPIVYEKRPIRSRAVSNASATSLLFMPPTSPLAKQTTSDDAARSDQTIAARRHTFCPLAFHSLLSSSHSDSSGDHPILRSPPSIPRGSLQHHHLYGHYTARAIPQTPSPRRRPSLSSDSPPLYHAPMVGSYEESILRGRMSTTPSRPLNFVAQIGVLGREDCKPSLRCPPHVTVGFPAVFYSYNGGSKITDSQPSPYVGLIDLAASASEKQARRGSLEERRVRKQKRVSRRLRDAADGGWDPRSSTSVAPVVSLEQPTSPPPRWPRPIKAPAGGYRIPPQGHLQIVIKNPHKTAVKLFRVPYDVSDMPAGTKTFVRQRSFVESSETLETGITRDRKPPPQSETRAPLRYLVHLNICCTFPGRHWLYGGIRVVFANRVPDGKETLRCETQVPEPRWSPYRPAAPATSRPTHHDHRLGFSPLESHDPRHRNLAISPRLSGIRNPSHLDMVDGLSHLHPPFPEKGNLVETSMVSPCTTTRSSNGTTQMTAEDRAKTQAEVQAKFEETYARAEAKERMNSRNAASNLLGRSENFFVHDYDMPDPR